MDFYWCVVTTAGTQHHFFFFQLMRAGPFFLREDELHCALVGRHAGYGRLLPPLADLRPHGLPVLQSIQPLPLLRLNHFLRLSLLAFATVTPVLCADLAAFHQGTRRICARPLSVASLDLVIASVFLTRRLLSLWSFCWPSCHLHLSTHKGKSHVACLQTASCVRLFLRAGLPLASPHGSLAITKHWANTCASPELRWHVAHCAVRVLASTHCLLATRLASCSEDEAAILADHQALLMDFFFAIEPRFETAFFFAGMGFFIDFFIPRIENLLASLDVLHVPCWELAVVICLSQSV